MILTSKETDYLKDLKSAEELCIEKYTRYAKEAKCTDLKNLFDCIAQTERGHLKVIGDMMAGNEPTPPTGTREANGCQWCHGCASVYSNAENKKCDQFLLSDMLSTEKHVSSVYDTGVFEFRSPAMRKMLSHIQTEEQQHGEMLYKFMSENSMYC